MVTTRIATLEDVRFLPEIEQSAGQTFLSVPELAWIATDDVTSEAVHAIRIGQGTTWVAEVDNTIAGFLSAELLAEELHVWELAVHFDWQGKGLGRLLMMDAIDHAHRQNLRSLTLTTFNDVPWNAPFYESLGFEILTADIPARLSQVLASEAENGLPVESRCAMILTLPEE